ncbi:MAG: hypothetical protein HYU57_01490 [Micavibrio aeruginosavorus]|nr:hypothetical protein [Micavibrio aeruginosavorus]
MVNHTLDLICAATEIPEFIEVDMTGIEIGDSIRMDRVKMPKGVEPSDHDPEHVLATMMAPKSAAADEAADAAAAEAASAASAAAAAPAAAPAGEKKEEKK